MGSTRLRTAWLANLTVGAAAVAVGAAPLRPATAFTRYERESVRGQPDSIIASDLEVVTVTDRSVVLTWTTRAPDRSGRLRPAATDTEVRIAPADGLAPPRTLCYDGDPTPYHYAEIDGLEPGRAYRFEARSAGRRAVPGSTRVTRRPGTPECTGVFTTLVPPPGPLVCTIALANDVHFGEQASGRLLGGIPAGSRHGADDHPRIMLDALLADLRRPDRGVDHLVVAGDLTDSGTPEQAAGVREQLDGWGELGRDYFVCRGNHDAPDPSGEDHWGAVFHARQQMSEHDAHGVRVIGLDTTRLRGSGGTMVAPQLDHLRDRLAADPHRPTLVFGHHPVTSCAAVSNPGGPGFVLDRCNAAALHGLYRATPGIFLHHSGHTHRNRLGRPDSGIDVEFLEGAAVKEYPGGYMMLRIHTGGYLVNFYKTRTPAARRWSTRTRRQYFGLHADHTLGTLADRNHVVLRDFSGLVRG